MKKLYFLVVILLTISIKDSDAQIINNENVLELSEILRADYGTCYRIRSFELCPEKKLIKVVKMFGTVTGDGFGYFPPCKCNPFR